MSFINTLYQSEIIQKFPKKILKKLYKKYRIYFVPTSLVTLPSNSHPIQININEQEKLKNEFYKKKNLVPWTTCPYIYQMLKIIFSGENLKFNFLDFGGERIDFYLYLKKNFTNINYYVFNQKEINNDLNKLKDKYNFENFNVLESIDDLKKHNYDFVNFGSVIQYLENYQSIIKNIIECSNKYIYFSGTHFYSNNFEAKDKIVVKQTNLLPRKNYCYFFNFDSFYKIFEKNNYLTIFKSKNITDEVNYKNFDPKYGNIEYMDILLSKKK